MMNSSMMAVVVITNTIMMRMVWVMRVMWIIWMIVIWIPVIVPIDARIAPIRSVIIRVPVVIPSIIIGVRPTVSVADDEAWGQSDYYICLRRCFFHYINGIDNPFGGVGDGVFCVDFFGSFFHGVGVEISVI